MNTRRAVATTALLLTSIGAARAQPAPAPEATPCLIEPHQLLKLASPVAALIDRVMVDRGAVVTRGMPVAHLSSALEEAEMAQARVRAGDDSTIRQKEARRDFTASKRARLDKLRTTSQYVSPTALEEADADARQAAAELQQAITQARMNQIELIQSTAKLDQRTIRSPVDGIVTERTLSLGEYAYEQAHIMTVAEIDPLNVEVYLPIARYGSVVVGTRAQVHPEAPVGGSYEATATVVDSVFDARSGTFGVRFALPNPDHKLPANIRCKISFGE